MAGAREPGRDARGVGSVGRATPPATLAAKIDRLFGAIHRPGRGEYSYEEVADAIRRGGGPTISATYLWQLRKGIRDNPTKRHLEALAGFFRVPVAYFFEDEATARIDGELDLLVALREARVRQIALRATGLSPRSLSAIAEMIESAREVEGLAAARAVDDLGQSGAPGGAAAPPGAGSQNAPPRRRRVAPPGR